MANGIPSPHLRFASSDWSQASTLLHCIKSFAIGLMNGQLVGRDEVVRASSQGFSDCFPPLEPLNDPA
jgi:hypothetical protein